MTRPPAGVEIRPAVPADADYIAAHLRAADTAECMAAGVADPRAAIADGIEHSALCWTALAGGVPVAVFGVRAWGDAGVPWLLGTDAMRSNQRAFIRLAPAYIDRMLAAFPRLMNHVHADNRRAVAWLRRAGFNLHPPHSHPSTGAPFQLFTMGY